MITLQFAFIGDIDVGKTTFIEAYEYFVKEYRLENEHQHLKTVNIVHSNKRLYIVLWDLPNEEMLIAHYKKALFQPCVVYICYAVNDYQSFLNIESYLKYVDRKRQKIILLALKTDLRENNFRDDLITKKEGEELKIRLSLDGFIECATCQNYNVFEALKLGMYLVDNSGFLKKNDNFLVKAYKYLLLSMWDFGFLRFLCCLRPKNNI